MKKDIFKYFSIYIIIPFLFFLLGCTGKNNGNNSLLPKASGTFGEIILVMDSAKWEGQIGKEIKKTFRSRVEGLPREEPLFNLHYVDPRKLNRVLKSARNMIFVTSFESKSRSTRILMNYFTENSLKRILEDSSLFMHINEDEFAKGQKVMYLFGKNDRQLINNIRENREALRDYFNQVVRERMKDALYVTNERTKINERLLDDHQFKMRIPYGYEIAMWEQNFVWIRNMGMEIDRNIWITYRDYTSQDQLKKEEIIEWRDNTLQKYIFEDPEKPETFVVTETLVPAIDEIVNFKGKYAIKLRGLWKTNNLSMGGPFISYTFVDESINRIYYIEGFLYSPGKGQREFVRELDIILNTFETQSELRVSG